MKRPNRLLSATWQILKEKRKERKKERKKEEEEEEEEEEELQGRSARLLYSQLYRIVPLLLNITPLSELTTFAS